MTVKPMTAPNRTYLENLLTSAQLMQIRSRTAIPGVGLSFRIETLSNDAKVKIYIRPIGNTDGDSMAWKGDHQ